MTRITVDVTLVERLGQSEGPVVLCDASGKGLGVFWPVREAEEGECPFGEQELDLRAQERSGRPLSDILADLERLYPS